MNAKPSPNVAYLTYRDARLVALATQAEQHFAGDPTVTLFKLRQFGEVLAQHAAANVGLFVSTERGNNSSSRATTDGFEEGDSLWSSAASAVYTVCIERGHAMKTEPTSVDLSAPCEHASEAPLRSVARPARGCEDCMKIGASWVQLRECLTCGHVGCCDSSPNKHATAHFHATRHPIMSSAEPGETWCWCYIDERTLG